MNRNEGNSPHTNPPRCDQLLVYWPACKTWQDVTGLLWHCRLKKRISNTYNTRIEPHILSLWERTATSFSHLDSPQKLYILNSYTISLLWKVDWDVIVRKAEFIPQKQVDTSHLLYLINKKSACRKLNDWMLDQVSELAFVATVDDEEDQCR